MLQDEKDKNVLKKAYEISYALFRVGSHLSSLSFKDGFESQALALLAAAARRDYPQTSRVAVAIEYLVQFGNDTGLVHRDNAEVLDAQVNLLKTAIAASGESTAQSAIPLDDIFIAEQAHQVANAPPQVIHAEILAQETEDEAIEEGEEGEVSGNAAMRQSAILERIRQSGNCRLKDIQEIFPGTSERTIRYDLQSLLEQNIIERVGNGGPSVFYRVRQVAG